MQVQGIIFDKDGTLFDFDATWGQWAHEMVLREAQDTQTRAQLADALGFDPATKTFQQGSIVIAETADAIAARICEVLGHLEKATLLARMNALAAEVPQVEVGDLKRLVALLRARNIQLGLATNDSEAPAYAHLAQAGIADDFALILGSDSGFGGKPASGQLDQFCRVTGLDSKACLMVGDSLHDLHAGRAAGMRTIGVLTGPATRADLAPAATVILASIAELPAWIAANT